MCFSHVFNMVKKFDLVDFGEDRAKDISEIMNNKTCKKILNLLKEKEFTETEISENLKIALSTVHYNLQKLIKNDLIKVKDFYWSPKGNKVNIYKASNKVFVFAQGKSRYLENKIKMFLPLIVLVSLLLVINLSYFYLQDQQMQEDKLARFKSGEDLVKAFEEVYKPERTGVIGSASGIRGIVASFFSGGKPQLAGGRIQSAGAGTTAGAESPQKPTDYSETNIQVEGVDEADIIKTDGGYIYTLAKGNLIITKAYPADEAEILSKLELGEFNPRELFINRDNLLVFGSVNYYFDKNEYGEKLPNPASMGAMSVRLYDVSDRENPEILRTVDFEGSYLTSRKIGSYVYFVVNSYPNYRDDVICGDIVPGYRESEDDLYPRISDIEPVARCTDIGYIEPIQAQSFITIASISMIDEDEEVEKEVIVGSGQNVYASLENLYIAQASWGSGSQKTAITKFELDDGKIEFVGNGEVKGHILNQFSMDEYNDYFRIATTIGRSSSNNVYILDEALEVVGELEDLAHGESIYSVRFMGKKAYVVTFKKIDPLFVIDLSNPLNPVVLGKLKIPGYSDYLHPYDETHIIGIGKEAVGAESGNFAWFQGVKMAIFDVSDVENPIEMHKVVIGDRGTDSEVLRDHKAFLFDRNKELLVIPITLAEIRGERTRDNQLGEFTFQGVYVYDISLDDGFDLRRRVTHYEDESTSFRGDSSIIRSLYIEDVLYTLSNKQLQLNDLDDLDEIDVLEF